MKSRIGAWLVAATAGLLLAVAGVGPAVFADGAWPERYLVLLVVAVGYGLSGLLAGYLNGSWHPGVVLIVPGILAGLLLGDRQLWVALLLLAIAVLSIMSSYGGAVLGARRRV